VREAGGFVTDLEGRDIALTSSGILAANEAIHRDLLRALKETHRAD
jgi:myo-inositol-1(or 4)-monophosphatase